MPSNTVEKQCIYPLLPQKTFESALKYKPTHNDLFIATFPKCGTIWTSQIIYLLLNRAVPPQKSIIFSKSMPHLEFAELSSEAEEESTIKAFKTHLPFHLMPYNENSKYIYCIRNPKDCCTSYWHWEKDFPHLGCNEFNQLFDNFINGKTTYGNYFDHVLGWIQNTDKPNILIIHYEDLKTDFITELYRIASFISEDLYSQLINDKEFRENVIKYSSFEFMKKTTNNQLKDIHEMPEEELNKDNDLLDGLKSALKWIQTEGPGDISKDVNFVRKGVVGDYKTLFTQQQNETINQMILSKFGHLNGLIEKWKYLF